VPEAGADRGVNHRLSFPAKAGNPVRRSDNFILYFETGITGSSAFADDDSNSARH
jgi:hypothetical protein